MKNNNGVCGSDAEDCVLTVDDLGVVTSRGFIVFLCCMTISSKASSESIKDAAS